jgi:glc operon protein GlcG
MLSDNIYARHDELEDGMADDNRGQQDADGSEGRDGLSRRRALGYGGAVVGGVAASSLLGAGPAAATNHGSGSVPTPSVSLDRANRIIEAGIRYVRSHNLPPMYFYVVDESGDEKASRRMDRNSPASLALVPPKARTAAAFRTPTADLAARTTDPARIASFVGAGFSLLAGGRPISENGTVIGAIGVGGGSPEQDDEVAKAALRDA